MFAGTALSVRLFVCAGLSLFIICGPYLSVVVCVFYTYNLTLKHVRDVGDRSSTPKGCNAIYVRDIGDHNNLQYT